MRYGGSDDVSFDMPESDFYCIHDKFHNCDLHSVHIGDYERATDIRVHEGDHYEDPWPLVRLNSDFVKNTKSLECSSVNENENIVTEGDRQTEFVFGNKDQEGDAVEHNANTRENGIHDALRVQTQRTHVSQALPSEATDRSGCLPDDRENPSKNGGKRKQRNPSSTCSDPMTFDEMIRNEIVNIEATRESGAASKGCGPTRTSSTNSRWKINALYAVVSNTHQSSGETDVRRRVSSRKERPISRKASSRSTKSVVTSTYAEEHGPSDGRTGIHEAKATTEFNTESYVKSDQSDTIVDTPQQIPESSQEDVLQTMDSKTVTSSNVTEPFKIRDYASGTVQFGK